MQIHVLTGDSLFHKFPASEIDGEIVVSRECLIEGALTGENLPEFWQTRAEYIKSAYDKDEDSYAKNVAGEYEKLLTFTSEDEVNLWFEYDLFCQVNLWFSLYLLSQSQTINIYRVAPTVRNQSDLWQGFGNLTSEQLQKCFSDRVKLTSEDVCLGVDLWQAYKNQNLTELQKLSKSESDCFPYLKDVCTAEVARKNQRRLENTLQEIASTGTTKFPEMFAQFSKKEGIYGFGDSQVKRLLAEMAGA